MSAARSVRIGDFEVANDRPLAIIAGPCQLESRQHALEMSAALAEMAAKAGVFLVYKTSFDKANRTSARIGRLFFRPKPRAVLTEVRLALSKEVL